MVSKSLVHNNYSKRLRWVLRGLSGKILQNSASLVKSLDHTLIVHLFRRPLFIVACNVASDMDRLKVLTVLDKANQERKIGNYELIKGLIQAVWKQQDLIADEKSTAQIDWRTLLDPTSTMPSFI